MLISFFIRLLFFVLNIFFSFTLRLITFIFIFFFIVDLIGYYFISYTYLYFGGEGDDVIEQIIKLIEQLLGGNLSLEEMLRILRLLGILVSAGLVFLAWLLPLITDTIRRIKGRNRENLTIDLTLITVCVDGIWYDAIFDLRDSSGTYLIFLYFFTPSVRVIRVDHPIAGRVTCVYRIDQEYIPNS